MQITSHLIEKLRETQGFKDWVTTYGKRLKLENAKEAQFVALSHAIIISLQDKLKSQKEKTELKESISARTLYRVFSRQPIKDEDSAARKKTLIVLMRYADIPDKSFDHFLNESINNQIVNPALLKGYWYLYRYTKKGIQRTLFLIEDGPMSDLRATYKSLHNTIFNDGMVHIAGKNLTITFQGTGKTIDICTFISENNLNGGRVLNGTIRSIKEDLPYATQCILVWECDSGKSLADEKAQYLFHSTVKIEDNRQDVIQDPLLDPLIIYLSRKERVITAKPFETSTLQGIDERNKVFGILDDNTFDKLNEQLTGEWISLELTGENEIKVLEWKFKFESRYRKCMVSLSGEPVLHGQALISRNFMTVDLVDGQKMPKIRVVLNSNNVDSERGVLKALSIVGDEVNFAATSSRKLFLKSDKFKSKKWKYKDFLEDEYLTITEKTFLTKQPIVNNPYHAHDLAPDPYLHKFISGKYLIYSIYDDKDGPLKQSCIEIDIVGRVVDHHYLEVDRHKHLHKVVEYLGRAEVLHNSVRITTENEQRQRMEYMFMINPPLHITPPLMQGIVMYVDEANNPRADTCIAIYVGTFSEAPSFVPALIDQSDTTFKILGEIMLEYVKIELKKYFFEMYPSIRYRKKD